MGTSVRKIRGHEEDERKKNEGKKIVVDKKEGVEFFFLPVM